MPSLRELQRRFAAALFDDPRDALRAEICADGIDSIERIGLYRQQLHGIFARTLAIEFPVIERLVGSEYFRRLALEFQAVHPSRAGNLHHIGAPFAAFLRERYRGSPYDYLADVAGLEWAVQESVIAPEAPAFDPRALQGVAAADYGQLRFAMHPACRLVGSPYPVLDIWHANQPGAAASEVIDLASGASRLLVQRHLQSVAIHVLSGPEFALLEALACNLCLRRALEAALQSDTGFDLGPALRRFVKLGAFVCAEDNSTRARDD